MRFVRWNSFTVIGVILLLIGIYGKIKGAGFEFDAGVPPEHLEAWYYMLVGALFVVNGYVFGKPLVIQTADENPQSGDASTSDDGKTGPVSPKSPSPVLPTK